MADTESGSIQVVECGARDGVRLPEKRRHHTQLRVRLPQSSIHACAPATSAAAALPHCGLRDAARRRRGGEADTPVRLTAPWHRCARSECEAEAAAPSAQELSRGAACGCSHSCTLVLDAGGRILCSSEVGAAAQLLGYAGGALDGIHITHLVEDAELQAVEELLTSGESCVLHLRGADGVSVTCRAELYTPTPSTRECCAASPTAELHILRLHASTACGPGGRDRLTRELGGMWEARETGVGVALLDLDGFRLVNESLGWEVGDELLRVLEARLAQAEGAGLWRSCGRVGDDEFYLLCAGEEQVLLDAVTQAQELLSAPVSLTSVEELSLTACAGWAHQDLPEGAGGRVRRGWAELLRGADRALGEAKRAGQGEVQGGERAAPESSQLRLLHELRIACEQPGAEGGRIEVHYQPTVELQHEGVHGVEALVRWNHPQRGLLSPGAFLALAEESDLICRIGQVVLATACADLAWLRTQPGCSSLQVNVNVVARQLRQVGFVEQVERSLTEAGLPPGALVLEVTEQTTIADSASSRLSLQLLCELGVRIAIDDFGTGYSALAYLPELPASILKIDRQFVQQIEQHEGQARLVRAITHLAHEFEMEVVAEGVEEPGQHRLLVQMGCEVGQGYLYSKPVPREALVEAVGRAAAAASTSAQEGPGS